MPLIVLPMRSILAYQLDWLIGLETHWLHYFSRSTMPTKAAIMKLNYCFCHDERQCRCMSRFIGYLMEKLDLAIGIQ